MDTFPFNPNPMPQIDPSFAKMLIEALTGGAVPSDWEVPRFDKQFGWQFGRPDVNFTPGAYTNVGGVNTQPNHVQISVSAISPEAYVPANMWQSIMNAYNLVREQWELSFGGLDGANVWGEILVPTGVHDLADTLDFKGASNLSMRAFAVGGGNSSSTGGVNAGGSMCQLVAPNIAGKWGIKVSPGTHPGRIQAGPYFEGIQIVGGTLNAGGFYFEAVDGFRLIHCGSSNFAVGTDLRILAGAYQSNYNLVIGFVGAGSKYGCDTRNEGDATFIHCVFDGTMNGNIAIRNGSIGFQEQGGSNRSLGLILQGYDTLHYNYDSIASCHIALRHEIWKTYGLRVGSAGGNPGMTAFMQSSNNSVSGGIGTGFQLDAGAQKTFILCPHAQAMAVVMNDTSGNNTNNSIIEGAIKLGSWSMNNSGNSQVDVWSKIVMQGLLYCVSDFVVGGHFCAQGSGGVRALTVVDTLPVYDSSNNLRGYLPIIS